MRTGRIAANPFHVLGLAPDAPAREVERAAQRWLAMLGVGLDEARRYATPDGHEPRDEGAVRQAVDALRDPERRALAEAWAALPPTPDPELGAPDPRAPWPEALGALGWEEG